MSGRGTVPVKAEGDGHTAITHVRLKDTQGGVWIRCSTCGGIHYTTVEGEITGAET